MVNLTTLYEIGAKFSHPKYDGASVLDNCHMVKLCVIVWLQEILRTLMTTSSSGTTLCAYLICKPPKVCALAIAKVCSRDTLDERQNECFLT